MQGTKEKFKQHYVDAAAPNTEGDRILKATYALLEEQETEINKAGEKNNRKVESLQKKLDKANEKVEALTKEVAELKTTTKTK